MRRCGARAARGGVQSTARVASILLVRPLRSAAPQEPPRVLRIGSQSVRGARVGRGRQVKDGSAASKSLGLSSLFRKPSTTGVFARVPPNP